ncbi:SARP family transcriptional regulator [Actinorhabdospora filicis]|uniref:SARP family transcriptional regulator n=1 Tax=Actinorhabdospora filicis TaxID=1785913 RepID=A0A9W6SL93_9ACTN|nr:AfsR/SARP family transcriptional regulator [Actinorhabdospora filicis]GLZ77985.1 SARP family transcriptional regulator [Actinorhabdospora filicis]
MSWDAGTGPTVALLGPFALHVGGRETPLTTGRLRTVLAVLAATAGRPVPVWRLAEAVWDDHPPASPKGSLQTYIGRLRRVLGHDRIATTPEGFTLTLPPDAVDALRFTRLLDRAAQAADPGTERALLTEALGLWRGEPFEGVRVPEALGAELTERRLAAVERRVDLDLPIGRAGDHVAELRELTSRHPLRETLWTRLLLALRHLGRQAEALEEYEGIRSRLAEELGSEPGAELRAVYAGLLTGEAPTTAVTDVPRQLPPDVDGFAGREQALRLLDTLAADRLAGHGPSTVAISGMAGVGKTSLALHWAHHTARHFPDGQLYVNLRGFAPGDRTVTPKEALSGFLDALGVPRERIPSDVDTMAGLYRSLLAARRVLVVLDNARDAAQARPLLPGGGGCLTVVTSRDNLAGLVAASAVPVPLGLLTDTEARALLRPRLRRTPSTQDEPAPAALIARGAGLPLALAILAARAALSPGIPLAAIVSGGLDALDHGDEETSLRAVFHWSYRALTAPAARMYRLLGLHPGAEITVPAAASLTGTPPRDAERALTELTAAHLVTETTPGRYTRHDLIRAHAHELTTAHDPEPERLQAIERLLDHYVHTAYAAMRLLQPQRRGIEPSPAAEGVRLAELGDLITALTWFTTEHSSLLAMVRLGFEHGLDAHTVRLAWALRNYLDWQGHWDDWAEVLTIALKAAECSGLTLAQISAHRGLARVLSMRAEHTAARDHLEAATRLAAGLDDPTELAHTHQSLAVHFDGRGMYAQEIEHGRCALELFRATGHRRGEAVALNAIG